ncbi:cysteine hydrolase family protein [Novosphingobium sp. AP12]|uniref:cysteine hydrolase family protein n=1 Tax=Novosphingobium sp. AP12 TaxID=1144305 RepID=UPI0002720A76|nr:isochorismatase family cysteine hydrolase [Novosphingobium sp. AP12]EJL32557.1 nicotinamidase-like amidase [Novosphingobium sp. AP12]
MPQTAHDPLISRLTTTKAALLVIDVQVDFVATEGFCARAGADVSAVPAAIANINRAVAAARAAGLTIVFVRLETAPETDSPAMLGHMERMGRGGGAALCRAGTPGAGYWTVAPEAGDLEIIKSRYDAFLETPLDARLRQRGIELLVITGVSTDCCVDSTTRAAFMRDYDVIVLADACAGSSPQSHDAALAALGRYAAAISDTDALVAALDPALVAA